MAVIQSGVPWTSGTDDNTTTLAAANAAMEDSAQLSDAELAALASDAELAAAIAGIDLSAYITKATLDANSILYATADDTPIPLLVAASRIVGRKASGNIDDMTTAELAALFGTPDGTKFLADDGTLKTPDGSGGLTFKQTMLKHSSNLTTTSTSYVDIDGTLLPALSLTLAIGDVVSVLLSIGNAFNTSGGNVICYDWLIDQPTSADTTFRAIHSCDDGFVYTQEGASNPRGIVVERTFVATEAGVHTFKPQWRVSAGTGTLSFSSASYDSFMTHRVTNLGPVAA